MRKAAVLMGSDSDWKTMEAAVKTLKEFQVPVEAHVMSAHRTPEASGIFARQAREQGFGVIICAAGMAAHLAGAIAGQTVLPVIGVPIGGGALSGMDALLATVQMPPGVPVATVGIDAARNAALLAVQMLALEEPKLFDALAAYKKNIAEQVAAKDLDISEKARALT